MGNIKEMCSAWLKALKNKEQGKLLQPTNLGKMAHDDDFDFIIGFYIHEILILDF